MAASKKTSIAARARSITLEVKGERVPGSWSVPESEDEIPAVLLLHGFSSSKEVMVSSVGRALHAWGIASLALDLPLHGERGSPGESPDFRNPLALVGAWRAAMRESTAAIGWMAEQPEIDASRLGILGYSLGGFLALMTAADDRRLGVVALVAAGDLPDATPYASLVRGVVDPLRAVRRIAGRPLLLVNGKRDSTTRPAQAQRLFDAADEPKTLTWYEGGHWPAAPVIATTADWVATQLKSMRAPRIRSTGRAS